MKFLVFGISIIFALLFAFSISEDAFADHAEVTIETVEQSGFGQDCVASGCYTPNTAIVDVGGKVIMMNSDTAGVHTFTSGTVSGFTPSPSGIFDSGVLMSGESFEWVPNTAGTVQYYCNLHTWMVGIIVVQEGTVQEPPSVSAWADKSSYEAGDIIKLSGKVTNPKSGIPVSIFVTGPDGNIIIVDQISLNYDDTFSTTLYAAGSLWVASGTYSFSVNYDGAKDGGSFSYSLAPRSISVWSDKLSYEKGDTIKISGTLTHPMSGMTVGFIVTSPDGDTRINSLTPNHNNEFSTTLSTGFLPIKTVGTYSFKVQYGSVSDSGSFYYSAASQEPTYPSPAPSGTDVVIPRGTGVPGCEETRSCYDPYRITVEQYSTVTWYNADTADHTVTSGLVSDERVGYEFDSSVFMSGESFSHKFNRDGTFNYFCMLHPWMKGQVIVQGGVPTPTYDTTPPKILKPTYIVVDAENNNGRYVSYDVLAIDETDQIVRPSCSPSSDSWFSVGTTKVTCNASDSSGNRAQSVSFSVTVNPLQLAIPDWVKNVAEFWCDDKIGDSSFIEGIQYLIDNNIIIVSATQSGYGSTQEIPSWVKNNACWWSEGLISNEDFASGIEYLVQEGIIRV